MRSKLLRPCRKTTSKEEKRGVPIEGRTQTLPRESSLKGRTYKSRTQQTRRIPGHQSKKKAQEEEEAPVGEGSNEGDLKRTAILSRDLPAIVGKEREAQAVLF